MSKQESQTPRQNAPSRTKSARGFATRLIIGLTSACCILLYQNCGADFVAMDDAQLAGLGAFTCGADLESAFSKSYYPFFRSSCAACHKENGNASALFAQSTVTPSFTEFNKTQQDKINTYAINPAHGGGAGGPQNTAAITAAENNFNSCKGGPGGPGQAVIVARTQPMPLGTPTAVTANLALRQYLTLDSQLELGATNLGGARLHFQVSFAMSGTDTVYAIAKPSISTGTSTVYVKGVWIRINGVRAPDAAQAFRLVPLKTINPGTTALAGQVPNGNISGGAAQITKTGAIQPTDTIQFEFEYLSVTPPP